MAKKYVKLSALILRPLRHVNILSLSVRAHTDVIARVITCMYICGECSKGQTENVYLGVSGNW
jgi:hypothetical protein